MKLIIMNISKKSQDISIWKIKIKIKIKIKRKRKRKRKCFDVFRYYYDIFWFIIYSDV
jgi:hypothetical protein